MNSSERVRIFRKPFSQVTREELAALIRDDRISLDPDMVPKYSEYDIRAMKLEWTLQEDECRPWLVRLADAVLRFHYDLLATPLDNLVNRLNRMF